MLATTELELAGLAFTTEPELAGLASKWLIPIVSASNTRSQIHPRLVAKILPTTQRRGGSNASANGSCNPTGAAEAGFLLAGFLFTQSATQNKIYKHAHLTSMGNDME